jgi:hypothetical protein
MAVTGFHYVVSNRSQMCTTNHGIPRIAKQKIIIPRIATKKIIIPRMATVKSLNLRSDCHAVTPVGSTFESGFLRGYFCCGKPRYPVPATLLYRQSLCSWRRIVLMRDFTSVKPMRSGLLSLNYTSMVAIF